MPHAGDVKVTVSLTGYITESQRVYVDDDEWKYLYFDNSTGYPLRAGLEGVVENESGIRLADMQVWAAGTLGTTGSYGCITGDDGAYSLGILSSGDYVIRCGKNNYIITEAGSYEAPSTVTSTTTIDFIGDKSMCRNVGVSDRLCVHNRSIVIKDDLDSSYANVVDEPDTGIVFAKVRKWTGWTLKAYNYMDDDFFWTD